MSNTTNGNSYHKKRISVALSGGVDSAVAAWILKQHGAEVSAVFMKNWEDDDNDSGCHDKDDLIAAAAAAAALDIPLDVMNFAAEYRAQVFAPFLRALKNGLTPNPDVLCNSEIKFEAFRRYAKENSAEYIATGHYARIIKNVDSVQLLKGEDSAKDQSYFLHRLTAAQLADSIFPLGEKHKQDVREIARRAALGNWARKDSVGICFVGEKPFAEFLQRYLPPAVGEMQTPEGKVVGAHQGIAFYTIGQRRGLGIGGGGDAWFVVGKRRRDNVLIVVQGESHPLLYSSQLKLTDCHWLVPPQTNRVYAARLRHQHEPAGCVLTDIENKNAALHFAEPQRAAAPGQYAVVYDGNVCMGGGEIAVQDEDAMRA